MNFYTDLDIMRSSAQGLNKVGGNLAITEIELRLLNLNMLFSSDASSSVKSNIEIVRKNIQVCHSQLQKLSQFLNDIVELYRLAEERNMYENQNRGMGDRKNVSAEDRRKYVEEYERNHPDEVRELQEFLKTGKPNNMTEEDLLNIKYLVYTAPAPFGLIYLKSMGDYRIGTTGTDGAYYSPNNRTVNYSYPDSFKNDPRGPYTTFFHETGHGIDDTSDLTKLNGSDTENFTAYSPEMGKRVTLREAIEYDVYYNKNNPHSMTSIAADIKARGGSGRNGNIDNVDNENETQQEPGGDTDRDPTDGSPSNPDGKDVILVHVDTDGDGDVDDDDDWVQLQKDPDTGKIEPDRQIQDATIEFTATVHEWEDAYTIEYNVYN